MRGLDYDRPADLSLLSDHEQRLAQHTVTRAEGRRYVARRIVIRQVLGAALNKHPRDLTIDRRCDRCQRFHPTPLLGGGRTVWWSTSSTGSTVAIAIGTSPVGIDLEPTAAGGHPGWQGVAHRFFSRAEYHAIADDERRFVASWTLKEAYLKALGVGLAGSLDALDSSLLGAGPDGWLRSAAYPDWSFRSMSPESGIAVGIAAQGTPGHLTLDTDQGRWTAQ